MEIKFIAQPGGVKVDKLGEVEVKLITSQKYRDQAMLIGGTCDGETLLEVTIRPYSGEVIGKSRRKPAEKVETE